MTIIEGLLVFFALVLAYFLVVIFLKKRGVLKKFNIDLYGPALLLRTEKGKRFLKKIASLKRFWRAFGTFGIVFCFIMMILMTSVLIWQVWAVMGFSEAQKEALPGPEVALVLPGINPILPLEYIGYILLALVIGIIVHEFSHGILTLVGKMKVKSLGILYMVIPVGAFCEPDEEQLKKTSTLKRMRVYSAGPLANFVVVLITLLLFSFVFMSAVQPAADGVTIVSTTEDAPAEKYSLESGMIITSVNDSAVRSYDDYVYVINQTSAGQEVNVTYFWHGMKTKKIVLSDKYEEYEKNWPDENDESFKGKGYLGIRPTSAEPFLSVLSNPFGYNAPARFMILYILPLLGYFQGYNPIVAPFTESYTIQGPLGGLPTGVFWMFVNALYWIFWLNLAVGLFNVLPMVPLDGGFLFNDAVGSVIKKLKKGISEEKKQDIVGKISIAISLMILLAIIFPFLIKYI